MTIRRSSVGGVEGPDGLELRLPRRFGQASGGLQVFAGMSLLFGGFFAFAGTRTLIDGSEDPQSAGGLALMVGLAMLAVAGLLLISRARIVVGREELIVCEYLGPLVRRRVIARADLRGLRVEESRGGRVGHRHAATARLQMRFADGSVLHVVGWYGVHVLRDVAERIAAELGFASDGEHADERDYFLPGEVADQGLSAADAGLRQISQRIPASNHASVEYSENGLTLTVPPSGVLRQHGMLRNFGLVFLLGGLFFGTLLIVKMQEEDVPSAFLLLPGMFVVVGLWMMIWPLALARRRSVFELARGELTVRRIGGFFGQRVQTWKVDKVQDVEVVDSTTSVNDDPLKQLSIKVGYQGRGMLVGRDEIELQWIAEKLRDGLGMLPQPADDES